MTYSARQIPNNFNEAMETEEKEHCRRAMEKELQNMEKHQVWDIVPRKNGMRIVKSKWVFIMKGGKNDTKRRYKTRLVVVGCRN